MRKWSRPSLLCTWVLLLSAQPTHGLPAVGLPATGNPRGWQAAAAAARTTVALTAETMQHQRPRIHEKASSLTGKLSAVVQADAVTAQAAQSSPGKPPSVQSQDARRDNKSLTAPLPAAPLLLLMMAAAFSAGYAVGRGRANHALGEVRDLAAAKVAAQGLGSTAAAAVSASAVQGSISAAPSSPVPEPVPAGAARAARRVAEEQHSTIASALNPATDTSVAADATARERQEEDSRTASLLCSGSEASSDVQQGFARSTGEGRSREALSNGQRAAPSTVDCGSGPLRSASSCAMLPHPVSGLVFLSHAVSGCSDSLERPSSSGSRAGIDDVLAADATSAASPLSHNNSPLCQEHGAQLACTGAEQQPVFARTSNDEASGAVSTVTEPPDHPEQTLSWTMRQPRSVHRPADACADSADLARAGGATEQVSKARFSGLSRHQLLPGRSPARC